jgi:hypothetical protein
MSKEAIASNILYRANVIISHMVNPLYDKTSREIAKTRIM